MATVYTGYRNHSRFYLSWDVVQQDIANNRSLVNWTVGIQGEPGWTAFWQLNAIRINNVYIDGQGNLASGTWSNITLANGATVPLRSGSVWIGHNGDGTKSFGVSMSGWLYQWGDIGTSGSMTAPTIPRNSQVTTNAGSYTLGSPITAHTNRKSTTFTHTISFKNNATGALLKQYTNVTDNVTWTPSSGEITTLQNLIPNSNTLNVTVEQWNNQVGQGSSVTVPFILTDANPVFTDFTYRDSNATVVAITGDNQVLVKGQSILETTISAANKMVAVKGASPSQYTIAYDGVTLQKPYQSTGDVVGTITDVATIGQRTLLVTATDSRTNNTSVAKPITVYDYTAPTIESTIERENNFGSDTTIHLQGSWNPLEIGGVAKNSLTTGSLKYRYREDAGGFGSWTSKGFTVTDDEWEVTLDFVVSLDNTKKYVFEFQITDRFGTVTSTDSVDVGKPIMFVGEVEEVPSIGIGKMPTDGALDVDGDIYANGLKVANGGWSEIGRIVGNITPTGTSITFEAHKFIKVECISVQNSPPGATEYVLRLQFNNLTSGTSYARNIMRIPTSGTPVYSVVDVDSILLSVTNGVRQQGTTEYTLNGYPSLNNTCIGNWTMSTEGTNWSTCYGNFLVRTSSPLTSLKLYAPTISYDVEFVIYGHN